MAHLIKLEDCVSRYQYDMYRYPSQFSRLKRERWKRLKQEWGSAYLNEDPTVEDYVEQQKKSFLDAFHKIKKWYKRERIERVNDEFEDQNYKFKYKTLTEVKSIFLQELYQFQLKWASSTLLEKSPINRSYYDDEFLKWLLQSLPDNYFILYYPVVRFPKAPVQFDILLIGPVEIWCIVNLDGNENGIFQKHSDRYWLEKVGDVEKKIINPFLSINRMNTILKSILAELEMDIPIQKAVITKKGYIDVEALWSKTLFLDQRSIQQWHEKLKKNTSPIKSIQLNFSQHLLNVCQTTSIQRQGYQVEEEEMKSFDYKD